MPSAATQRDLAISLLEEHGILRLVELRDAGVTAATISRMQKAGEVVRLGRGVYQLTDAPLDVHHALAQASKVVPKGVVCLVSALAFHGLTDQLPPTVWVAIETKDWIPKSPEIPIKVIRIGKSLLGRGVEVHNIQGVPVKIFSVPRTVVNCFRFRNRIGLSIAIEGLQESLRQGKTTPAEIMLEAKHGRVTNVIRPYLEALTANG